ncbi:BRCA1-associated RING domain protein 1 isoform X1, partial [Tanacetum coccineum]
QKTQGTGLDTEVSVTLISCIFHFFLQTELDIRCSAGEEDEYSLVDFARGNGAVVSKYWRMEVTHVIAATDSTGLQACAKAGKLVDEEPYEVFLDTHGASGGPKAGRLRVKETSCLFVCTCKRDKYIVAHYCSGYSDEHCSYRPKVAQKRQVLRHELKSRTHDELQVRRFCRWCLVVNYIALEGSFDACSQTDQLFSL